MTAIPFTSDWQVRRPLGPFDGAGEPVAATSVRLPHDALRDEPRSANAPARGATAYYPRGAYTYLKTFAAPAAWAGRPVRLEIQGAFRRAQVFVNDELAGNRADGYARFFVDLGPFLRYGAENVLRIELRAGEDSRWYSGAGLHRGVVLHVDEPVHVVPDGLDVDTVLLDEGGAILELRAWVANAGTLTRTVRVRAAVDGPDGAELLAEEAPLTLVPGETGILRRRVFVADPALWSVDHPALHTLRVTLDGAAEARQTFGIRTIAVDAQRGLRINGEPVLLRGACVHHDNGPLGAAAIPRAEERRIELLKAAGFTAIRAAHNPLSPAMLDACDRVGMLVMDEAFDMWTRFKTPYDYAAEFPQWWAEDLAALVAKDRNHPSVILYSIGNEIAEVGTPHGARWSRRLAEHVRALDPTRPVTNGVNALLAVLDELGDLRAQLGTINDAGDAFSAISATDRATARIEEAAATLDVLGLNYAESRYALDQRLAPHRVIVGSETFASRIGDLWPQVVAHPNVIGDFTWTGWDYLGEVGIGATAYAEDADATPALEREFPFLTAWTGDLDITGFRRPVSYYREIVFGLRREPYIAVRRPEHHAHTIAMQSPWAWSDSVSSWTWPGHENAPVTVEVYADADEVVLELDGAEVGRAAVGRVGTAGETPLVAVVETVYVPGELVAIAYRGGVEAGRTALATAGEARLRATADRDRITADDADLAYLALELVDDAGRPVTAAEATVTVRVTGAGELAGMASARPSTTERFADATWRTFDGRAIAVVRPTGPGAIVVTAEAEGYAPQIVRVEAIAPAAG
ncbi:glycoside hydrolase family 2 TIM barrel-domain containing protein [Microbacterium sp. X-17]|uniref:glycoside hydrolase family 2 TIM barrel-domain containing protein n=1 Tax=Microbacterium sp. X-17 TaxID=3144404 RepID=UPI0031F4E6EE